MFTQFWYSYKTYMILLVLTFFYTCILTQIFTSHHNEYHKSRKRG